MAVFSKANKVESPKPKTAKNKHVEEVKIEGLDAYAALDKVGKAIATVQETLAANIKSEVTDTFIGIGMQQKRRPDNFKGIGQSATASMQLKTMSSRSIITEENAKRLMDNGVPVKEVDEVVETFILNPAYANNAEIMSKMEDALADLGLPADLFLHQSKKKYVVDGDNTLNALFNLPSRKLISELMPLVTSLAIKPTTDSSMKEAMDTVLDFLGDEPRLGDEEGEV